MSSKWSIKASVTNKLDNFDSQFGMPLCGIDEVGRGPLAGPVTSACVMIKPDSLENPLWQTITDSKKLTAKKREMLHDFIMENAWVGLAELPPQDIDRLNIHHATLAAMKKAYEAMYATCPQAPQLALIDGKFSPALPCKTQTVVKGDSLSISIGAASIIAKVTRDRQMAALHDKYPHYGWNSNAGYGTKVHMEGLERHGVTPHHRLSFAPCAAAKGAKISISYFK
jgi:ribonuclease HII